MIRVMYIVNESGLGGAAQSLLDMLAVNDGRICPIVIIPSAGIIEERLQQLHISYHIVPFDTDHRKIGGHSQKEDALIFRSNYEAALKLQEIVRQQKIEMIHTNSSVSNVGAMLSLMTGIPHIWHIRELLEEHFGCEFVDGDLKKKLFACADGVVSISECVGKIYKKKYEVDCVCIYDGLHIERFIERDFSAKKANAFLMAGQITSNKGQLDAIKAVYELAKQNIDTRLYIVGAAESDYYRWLLHRCVRKCKLEHHIQILAHKKDLRELRHECQYSITGSKMEALGRVTIEAMLAGCVVIGADTGGTVEIIGQDGSRGYLYRQGDYRDLARVMRYALEHSKNNRFIQNAAQDYATETFDASNYLERIILLYEEVLQDKKNSAMSSNRELLEELRNRYAMVKDIDTDIVPSEQYDIDHDKSRMLAEIIRRWFSIKLEKKSLDTVLSQRGIYSAAIYGMGFLGKSLYQELEDSAVGIAYVMDRALQDDEGILKVVSLDEELPQVDAVIVTVLGSTDELCERIKRKSGYQVITLKNLLDWCEEEL